MTVEASQSWRWLYLWLSACLVMGFLATAFGFVTFVRPDDRISAAPAGTVTFAWTRYGLIWRRWESPSASSAGINPQLTLKADAQNYAVFEVGHSYAANGLTYTRYAYTVVPAEVSGGVAFFAFIGAAFALKAAIRRRADYFAGRCTQCGYDLRATPWRCPECGLVV